MDWDCYKQRCDTPEAFSRWMLEQTGELLDETLRQSLVQAVAGEPIRKPCDHKGGDLTDMFVLTMKPAEVRIIFARVVAAVAAGETTSGTHSRGLGGFEEAWREYMEYLESEHGDVRAGAR